MAIRKERRISIEALLGMLLVALVVPYGRGSATRGRADHEFNQDETIRLSTNLIEVFLTVRDDNRFVNDLTEANFEVYDEGIQQQLAFFETEDRPVSIALLLDTSGSMQRVMGMLQDAAGKFVQGLKAEDEVTVIGFGGMVKELAPLSRDKSKLTDAINQTTSEGATPLYDAIVRAILKLEAGSGRRAIVLITDGMDTQSQLSADSVIKMSGQMAVPLFAIGAGEALKEYKLRNTLEEMTERTGGKAFFVKMEELPKAFKEITANLKASYRAGYYVNKQMDGKWHTLSVRLKSAKGRVITREGYYARAIRRK